MFPTISAPETDLKRFLTKFDVTDQDIARQRWDQSSGASGLLDQRGYTWDPRREKFIRHSTGRAVSDRDLRLYVLRVSNRTQAEMKEETNRLVEGSILFAVWYARMRNLMKSLYYTLWMVGVGGFLFDDSTQRNLFYLFILSQFGYLDNFKSQLETGIQELNGWAVTRAGMYGAYGNVGFQNMNLARRRSRGFREARRILGENENHCNDSEDRRGCIELADLGWTPIERIVPIGDATCYSNCHCWYEYRR